MLPNNLKRYLFQLALGWKIGPGSKIGCSIILCSNVLIGAHCRVGHFNIIYNLKSFTIGDRSKIGNLNHFIAHWAPTWPGAFSIGRDSRITSRHFFDCSGKIEIGDFCCVGGRDSQCWTHVLTIPGMDLVQWRELKIEPRCYIAARATLVYCKIPADSIVGAGAVVIKDFLDQGTGLLIAGNPATVRKRLFEVNPIR